MIHAPLCCKENLQKMFKLNVINCFSYCCNYSPGVLVTHLFVHGHDHGYLYFRFNVQDPTRLHPEQARCECALANIVLFLTPFPHLWSHLISLLLLLSLSLSLSLPPFLSHLAVPCSFLHSLHSFQATTITIAGSCSL